MRSRLLIMYLGADETASEQAGQPRGMHGSDWGRRAEVASSPSSEEHLGALDSLALSWGSVTQRSLSVGRLLKKAVLLRSPECSLCFHKDGRCCAEPLTLAVTRPPRTVLALLEATVLPCL